MQRCPMQCIAMSEDDQGFQYPKVDVEKCIECGLCETVCPVINQASPRKPQNVYAAKNRDKDTLINSSSGGIFFALAKSVISEGGVVFGARFNEKWEVVHDFAETLEEVHTFQGSKYVQSRIGDTFKIAEKFLKDGRRVMFTGTPCQISGLRLFLRKPYDNLLAVDVVCHGVPSPLVWREYLKHITRPECVAKNTDFQSTLCDKKPIITGIDFRDKRLGWEKFGFSVHAVARQGDKNSDSQSTIGLPEEQELLFEPHDKNLFMQIFLKDLDLRPSCNICPAKCGKSQSDITLADFWGSKRYVPDTYDYNGVSLVLVNTPNGDTNFKSLSIASKAISYEIALMSNPSIEKSAGKPKQYDIFWESFNFDKFIKIPAILRRMKPSILKRAIFKIRLILRKYLFHN